MFPVTSHLTRHSDPSTPSTSSQSPTTATGTATNDEGGPGVEPVKDRVLDLFEPLFGDSRQNLSVGSVKVVREKLEAAAIENKVRLRPRSAGPRLPEPSRAQADGHPLSTLLKGRPGMCANLL